jgi:Dioxygenase
VGHGGRATAGREAISVLTGAHAEESSVRADLRRHHVDAVMERHVWGALPRAQGRHKLRPAHLHFMIHKPGFKTQFSQVDSSDDPNLEVDVQFGITRALIGQYVRHTDMPAPDADVTGACYSLEHRFVIEPGDDRLPRPPISAKAQGERPRRTVLERRDRAAAPTSGRP